MCQKTGVGDIRIERMEGRVGRVGFGGGSHYWDPGVTDWFHLSSVVKESPY